MDSNTALLVAGAVVLIGVLFTLSFRVCLFHWCTRIYNLRLPIWAAVVAGIVWWIMTGVHYV